MKTLLISVTAMLFVVGGAWLVAFSTSGAPMWYELADEEGILESINRTINPFVRDITVDDLRVVVQ